ncbi:MAG: T9SS type A sorting domain-containing protein [Saprospiraceae bacterium]|nr:T9SS type A sorting domain-containing protein [Saprospiraceae bacterium]
MKLLFLFLFNVFCLMLQAKVWHVGPNRDYTRPSQVSSLVDHGDTVYIDPGVYDNDACKWNKNKLKLIGIVGDNGRPVLRYEGYVPNDKGIWVFDNPGSSDDIYIANLIFDGARVPDNKGKNGAGIRFQANNLTVENCLFRNCQTGILEGHGAVKTSNVIIRGCEFFDNGYSGYEHHVYINASTDTLVIENCYLHRPRGEGNSIKTRAQNAYILYNFIDEEDGNGSYEINIAQGGNNIIMGNVIVQGTSGGNHAIVGYDEALNEQEDFYFINNTVINRFPGHCRYFNIAPATGIATFRVYNNVFASVPTASHTFISGNVPAVLDSAANYFATDYTQVGFVDPDQGDYSIHGAASGLINQGVAAGTDKHGYPLVPDSMYQGIGKQLLPRIIHGQAIDLGAYEYATTEKAATIHPLVSVFPNPNTGTFEIRVNPVSKSLPKIYNSAGMKVDAGISASQEGMIRVCLSGAFPGIYYVVFVSENGSTSVPVMVY